MNVGLIYTCYQTEDLIERSLRPWIKARASCLGGHTFTICAVSVPFEGFEHTEPRDRTWEKLDLRLMDDDIDCVIAQEIPMPETEARGAALRWLMEQGATLSVQWDSDEIATEQDILNILSYVEANPYIPSFRVSYRNSVFTEDQYLADPFTPMRIHRKYLPTGHIIKDFWDDNNVSFWKPWDDNRVATRDIDMAVMTIPKEVAWPKHLTWLDDGPNGRSAAKIRYQMARGWSCSYRYDEERGLCFNEEHFAQRGESLPIVLTATP